MICAENIPFLERWVNRLKHLPQQNALTFFKTHTYFGHYMGDLVNDFIKNIFEHRIKLIESIKDKNLIGVKSCFGTKFAYAPVILVSWILVGLNLLNVPT